MSDVPSSVEEAIYRAVQVAVWSGVSAEVFKRELIETWEHVLREEIEQARHVLSKS